MLGFPGLPVSFWGLIDLLSVSSESDMPFSSSSDAAAVSSLSLQAPEFSSSSPSIAFSSSSNLRIRDSMAPINSRLTWAFCRNSDMSIVHAGHFMTFFWVLSERPPVFLSLTNFWPPNAPSKHDLQKLCAQGVVIGRVNTLRQRRQLNSLKILALESFLERGFPAPFSFADLLGGGGFLHFQLHSFSSKSQCGLSFLSVKSIAFFSSGTSGNGLGRSPRSSLVQGAGLLSHLTNRYLQTIKP
uniref:Uncharacterized protein n=1 Tax=Opuntia streptacantha TaxID=393608 RepID=A0A7C9EP16_OPUST